MKYVTTIERRAIEQGIERGRLQTLREMVVEALQLRFERIPDEVLTALAKLSDLQQLKNLHRQAIIIPSLEEFEHLLAAKIQG